MRRPSPAAPPEPGAVPSAPAAFPAAPGGEATVGPGPSPSSIPTTTDEGQPDVVRLRAMSAVAAAALAEAPAYRRELFDVRLTKWWPDLWAGIAELYPTPSAQALGLRLVELAAASFAGRDAELQHLDLVRTLSPDWFQSQTMPGYAAYAERFAGDLAGVGE
ncbi:MAG: hypothetical protein ABJA16_13555, partial [Nakamurella sp.]